MAQGAQQIDLVLKPFSVDWLGIKLHAQRLYSYVAINAQLICFVDNAHAARAEHFLDFKPVVENCSNQWINSLFVWTRW